MSIFCFFFLSLFNFLLAAQSSSFENFDAYTEGTGIAAPSNDWKIWVSSEDAFISNAQAFSGNRNIEKEKAFYSKCPLASLIL